MHRAATANRAMMVVNVFIVKAVAFPALVSKPLTKDITTPVSSLRSIRLPAEFREHVLAEPPLAQAGAAHRFRAIGT